MRSVFSFAFISLGGGIAAAAVLALASRPAASVDGTEPVNSPFVAETVYNLNRVKILESNTSSLRPGSVYDVATYFELLPRFPKPGYNYEFIDSGLGATEPLYPMYQKGKQGELFAANPGLLLRLPPHRPPLVADDAGRLQGRQRLPPAQSQRISGDRCS